MTRTESKNGISRQYSQNRSQTAFVWAPSPVGLRARGRRGESLTSPRDRQRLRERDSAERERVETMLAGVPVPVERRRQVRDPEAVYAEPRLRAVQPAPCPVCGIGQVVADEVMHGGALRISECLHCEHRWTQRPKRHWARNGEIRSA